MLTKFLIKCHLSRLSLSMLLLRNMRTVRLHPFPVRGGVCEWDLHVLKNIQCISSCFLMSLPFCQIIKWAWTKNSCTLCMRIVFLEPPLWNSGSALVGWSLTLHQNLEVGCQAYTRICSAARTVQIAAFQLACLHFIKWLTAHTFGMHNSGYRFDTRPPIYCLRSGFALLDQPLPLTYNQYFHWTVTWCNAYQTATANPTGLYLLTIASICCFVISSISVALSGQGLRWSPREYLPNIESWLPTKLV